MESPIVTLELLFEEQIEGDSLSSFHADIQYFRNEDLTWRLFMFMPGDVDQEEFEFEYPATPIESIGVALAPVLSGSAFSSSEASGSWASPQRSSKRSPD